MALFGIGKKKKETLDGHNLSSEERFEKLLSGNAEAKHLAIEHVLVGPPSRQHVFRWIEQRTFSARWNDILALAPELESQVQDRLIAAMPESYARPTNKWLRATDGVVAGDAKAQITMAELEAMGPTLGYGPAEILELVFRRHLIGASRSVWRSVADFEPWIRSRCEQIKPILSVTKAETGPRWSILQDLDPETIAMFAEPAAIALTSNIKALHSAVRPIVRMLNFELLEEHLKNLAVVGDPAVRANAISFLFQTVPDDQRPRLITWARETCGDDRSPKVRAIVAAVAVEVQPVETAEVALPKLDYEAAFPRKLQARIRVAADRTWNHHNVFPATIAQVIAGRPVTNRIWGLAGAFERVLKTDPGLAEEFTPSLWAKVLTIDGSTGSHNELASLLSLTDGSPTPLELHLMGAHHRSNERHLTLMILNTLAVANFTGQWSAADIEAWVLHNRQNLQDLLTERTDWNWSSEGLFAAFGTVTEMPSDLRSAIIECGINGPASHRPHARLLLGADVTDEVIPYLSSGKGADRSGAALWLRELRNPSAADALRTTLKKEKQDLVKTHLMTALEASGASIDEFVSPEALASDATKALTKKNAIPKSMNWLDVDKLPVVRWAADQSPVDATILTWFLASAVKAKSAEPSPLMRRHMAEMNNEDLQRFGAELFELWVYEDGRSMTQDEIEQEARSQAARMVRWFSGPGAGATHPRAKMTEEEFYEEAVAGYSTYPPGRSAADSKGILAVVAASAGPELAPTVHSFLKKHRGRKLSQGKAMLQMLSWMDEPQATQVLLSVSQRFRPKSFAKAATDYSRDLAARNGWTLEDLADRTVPEAGFGPDGRQTIDYGERSFTAHLGDDLTISLVNDETNKKIKALPAARTSEDADEIKEIKKDFTAAKKELKATAALQPTRLFQAMCGQRTWTGEDFQRYMVDHPVMARLASKLVWWTAVDEEKKRLFRPLTDGTMINADDEELRLDSHAKVGLAHDELVTASEANDWVQHLADYEVAPLFPQFNRPEVRANPKNLIEDFRGHLMPEATFRSQMNAFAWELGPPQDGGWVGDITKDFPSVRVKAVLNHSGVSAGGYYGGDPIQVALLELFFVPSTQHPNEQAALKLDGLPPIVLREIYAEVKQMANAGELDPDWKSKAGL